MKLNNTSLNFWMAEIILQPILGWQTHLTKPSINLVRHAALALREVHVRMELSAMLIEPSSYLFHL